MGKEERGTKEARTLLLDIEGVASYPHKLEVGRALDHW
jgi:hypothetical protein